MTTTELVARQLDAYNARDIDAFCKVYSEDVTVYSLKENKTICRGIDEFRKKYTDLFEASPNLHATISNRLTLKDFVIDEETVSGRRNETVQAIAIYKVTGDKISHVWFAQ